MKNIHEPRTGLGEYDYEEHDPDAWKYDIVIISSVSGIIICIFLIGFFFGSL